MTVSYLPPGRPGDARWNAPGRRPEDSPKQARLRRHARRAVWWVMACAVMLATFVIANLVEIRGIRDTAHPTEHRASGVVDVLKASRRHPVFRLSRPGADPLRFECLRQVVATPACPGASEDWRARELSVEWITMPTLLPAWTNARVTRLAAGDDVLFAASPRAVQDAEVANLEAANQEACWMLGGFMLVWGVVAAILWSWLGSVTRQIEAAHRRARG